MTDKFEIWKERARKHDLEHTTLARNKQKDVSCEICYPGSEIPEKGFRRFWKWFKREIPQVKGYNGNTEENFSTLMNDYKEGENKFTGKIRKVVIDTKP